MGYSAEAIAFSVIPVGEQVRLEDRVASVYLERCTIVQAKTGVVALSQEDRELHRRALQLPVGGIAVLELGPGTSITHAAMTSCTRSGVTVLFCGGGGVPAYSHATPLTSSARWAIAQACMVADERKQRAAAKVLYAYQLGIPDMGKATIASMRGIEGRLIRNLYRDEARKRKVRGFRRDVKATDDVNVALNIANSMLYGAAAAVCAAIGVNPALGIIHRGDARSLLFDLADLFKPRLTIPLAFAAAGAEDVPETIRKTMRRQMARQKVTQQMLEVLLEVLEPHLPHRTDDRLVGDRAEVAGHTQYGDEVAATVVEP